MVIESNASCDHTADDCDCCVADMLCAVSPAKSASRADVPSLARAVSRPKKTKKKKKQKKKKKEEDEDATADEEDAAARVGADHTVELFKTKGRWALAVSVDGEENE